MPRYKKKREQALKEGTLLQADAELGKGISHSIINPHLARNTLIFFRIFDFSDITHKYRSVKKCLAFLAKIIKFHGQNEQKACFSFLCKILLC